MNYSTFVKSITEQTNLISSFKEHYDLVPDASLLESYSQELKSNRFTTDPVILDLRENQSSLTHRFEYTLNDGNNVSITEDTQNLLNQILINNSKVINFMNESKDNFISVIQEIIKE